VESQWVGRRPAVLVLSLHSAKAPTDLSRNGYGREDGTTNHKISCYYYYYY